jgi:hypothetical protein
LTGQGDKVLTQTAGQALGNAARDPVQNSFLGTGDVLPGAVPGTWEIEINGEIRAFPTKEAAKAAAKEYAKNAGTPKAYKVTTSDGATHTFYDKKEAKDFADANKIKSVKDVYTVTLEDGSVQEFSSLKAAQQAAQKNSRASAAETWTTSDGKVHASREAAEQYAREKGVSAAPYYMVDGDGTRYSTKAEADAAAQGLAGKPLTADALITKMSAGLKTRGLTDAEVNKILYGEAGIRTAATDKALVDAYGTGGTLQGRVTRESDSNKTGLEYLKSLIDTTLTPQTNDAYWAGEQGKAVLTDIEKKLKNLDADGRKAYNEALVSGKYTTVAEAVSGINDAFAKRNEAVLGKVTTNQDGTRTSSKGLMPISFGGVDNWFTPDTYAKIQAQATKTGKSIEDAYKIMSKEGAFNNSSEGYTIIRDITYTAPQSQKSTLDYSVTLGPVASAPGVRSFDGTNTPLEIQYEAAGAGFIPEINTTPGTEAYKPKIETQKAVTVEAPEVEYRKGTGGIEFEQVTPDYIADPIEPVPQDIEYNPEHGWTYQGGNYSGGNQSIGFSLDEGYTPEAVVQAPEEETRNWAEYVNTQYGSPLVYSDEGLKKIRYFTVPKSRKLREAFERLANELR